MRVPAWVYDAFMWPLEKLFLRGPRRRLLDGLTGRTLEIGAGTGANLKACAGALTFGLEPSLEFLRKARSRDPGVQLVCGRAEALPFKSGAFDAVVESLVLCSVRHPEAALAEVGRVLKAGGELRTLDHVRAPGKVLGPVLDALTPPWLQLTGECHLNRDVAALVGASGLQIERRSQRLRGVVEELVVRR